MKKALLYSLTMIPLLFLTGCGEILVTIKNKQNQTQTPQKLGNSQELTDSGTPQNNNSSDSFSEKSITVGGVKIYTDDRNWSYRIDEDGDYEIMPDGKDFESEREGMLLMVKNEPMPRLSEQNAGELIKHMFAGAKKDNIDLQVTPIRTTSSEYFYKIKMDMGIVLEGYFKLFGNSEKSVFLLYLNAKAISDDEMKQWENRISKTTVGESF
jgi:hypothetical protein